MTFLIVYDLIFIVLEVILLSELKDRINKVISVSGIRKTDFAKKIKVSQAFVSQLCAGTSQPSDRTIADICREFGVNEIWLRTGEGEMFDPVTPDEELADFFGDILAGEPDFKRRFIYALSRLSSEQWEMLEKVATQLVADMQKESDDQI